MNEYIINEKKYKFVKGDKDIIDVSELNEKVTDYFSDYDYIFGDIAYNKLRLKGFCDSSNKMCRPINDVKNVDDYLANYCAYKCKYFLVKKCN